MMRFFFFFKFWPEGGAAVEILSSGERESALRSCFAGEKKFKVSKVKRVHPLGMMNVLVNCHGSCWVF